MFEIPVILGQEILDPAGQVAVDIAQGMITTLAWNGNPSDGPRAPQVYFSKPDLQQEMEREARLGPLDVQVCGPERMTASVVQIARGLNSQGFQVELDVHDSAL